MCRSNDSLCSSSRRRRRRSQFLLFLLWSTTTKRTTQQQSNSQARHIVLKSSLKKRKKKKKATTNPSSEDDSCSQTKKKKKKQKPNRVAHYGSSSSPTPVTNNNVATRKNKKHVTFESVYIREYSMTLGDHPCAAASGPPISLDWEHGPTYRMDMDAFESQQHEEEEDEEEEKGLAMVQQQRQHRKVRDRTQLRMSLIQRERILLHRGFTMKDIKSAWEACLQIRQERYETALTAMMMFRVQGRRRRRGRAFSYHPHYDYEHPTNRSISTIVGQTAWPLLWRGSDGSTNNIITSLLLTRSDPIHDESRTGDTREKTAAKEKVVCHESINTSTKTKPNAGHDGFFESILLRCCQTLGVVISDHHNKNKNNTNSNKVTTAMNSTDNTWATTTTSQEDNASMLSTTTTTTTRRSTILSSLLFSSLDNDESLFDFICWDSYYLFRD